MLELNRRKVRDPKVRYIAADLFSWEPDDRNDVVFFGLWLSHVPMSRFEQFWDLVADCLAPSGRVFFVDESGPPTGEGRSSWRRRASSCGGGCKTAASIGP
jgi:hypothetical protein